MTDSALLYSSVSSLRQQLRDRMVSSEEITRACLERIEACNGELNAVITMCGKGRSPSMRHVNRTHRVNLDALSERLLKDGSILIKYIYITKKQLFTKSH